MIRGILYSLMSTEFFLKFLKGFLAIFGAITALLKPLNTYFPQHIPLGLKGVISHLLISIILSLIINFPKWKFSSKISSPNCKVTVKTGDLLKEKGNLVIGVNDVFDTEIGEVIKARSLQGQFLTQTYSSNQILLDQDIDNALKELNIVGTKDINKNRGKQNRYPIGTTVTLGTAEQRYFLSAYSYMGNDLVAKSSLDDLWHSLNCLWQEIRIKGQGNKVSMGVLGAGLARIPSARRDILIKLIVLSFVSSSKVEFIAEELIIVILPSELEYINMVELQNTVKKLCY